MGKPTALGSAGGAQILTVELDGPAWGFSGVFLLAEAAGCITGQFAKDKRLLEKTPASQSISMSLAQVTDSAQFCLDFFYSSGKLPPKPQIPLDKYVLQISKWGFDRFLWSECSFYLWKWNHSQNAIWNRNTPHHDLKFPFEKHGTCHLNSEILTLSRWV